jgi:NAD(P)-dependent dehydrogenase (short-subunit alcohol dehydrogenase family)
MESLAPEVEPFGIHATVVNPGFFRTELLTKESTNYAEASIEDYAERNAAQREFWDGQTGKQVGDPAKLAQALLTITDQEQPPFRFIAGADAIAQAEEKLAERRQQIDAYRELSTSLALDETGERMTPTYDFADQVALVTGASSGMELATARAFADGGAAVVLADIDEDALRTAVEELTSAGHHALGITCDVADEAQVAAMVERTVAPFGRLDMAFNNAGIVGYTGDLADESADSFDAVTAVNLRGVWNCMKHELLQMREQGSGAIVNCSSLGGLVGGAGRASYHAAKHGVIGLTKSAALDYAPLGIRVNAVCPGVIDTPMAADLIHNQPEAMKQFMRDQPIGRPGRADDVAAAAIWLCSPGASFVLGVALPVDGGFVAH